MGYRSEWQLLVKGKKEAVDRFVAHLQAEKDKPENQVSKGDYYSRASVYETILQCEVSQEEFGDPPHGEIGIQFGDNGTKCYAPWEEVIRELVEFAEDELGLEIAYGELGEDIDDSTFINNGSLYVSYTRILDEPNW